MYPLLFNLGMTEILVILLLVVLFFGGKKIPEMMRGMGRGVREFKDALEKPAGETEKTGAEKPEKPEKTEAGKEERSEPKA